MNIMLSPSPSEPARSSEGGRGAARRDLAQFLIQAVLLSLLGGIATSRSA
jgi:hypothetical protein